MEERGYFRIYIGVMIGKVVKWPGNGAKILRKNITKI